MTRVYWDAMLFVYLLDGNPVYEADVKRLANQIEARGDRLCTSVFTVGEVLTGPHKNRRPEAAARARDFFRCGVVELLPLTFETAERYAQVRAAFGVKQADGVHLATASVAEVDLFITNDHQLLKLRVPGIKFMSGLDGRIT